MTVAERIRRREGLPRPGLADMNWEMLTALQALELLRAQQSYAKWVGSRMAYHIGIVAEKAGIEFAVEKFADATWRTATLRAFALGETWHDVAVASAMARIEELVMKHMGVS